MRWFRNKKIFPAEHINYLQIGFCGSATFSAFKFAFNALKNGELEL